MSRARLAALGGALALLIVALWAGEYSTRDWLIMRRQVAEEQRAVAELRLELDSLARLARDLETNPAVQERVAREEFGMIRPGEILYRVVPGRR